MGKTIYDNENKVSLTVQIHNLTVSQLLTLKEFFKYWEYLGKIGSSREVAFYCDGDGNFRPTIEFKQSSKVPELTDVEKQLTIKHDHNGDRLYDFDNLAWSFHSNNARE